jgi:hypothetical protein
MSALWNGEAPRRGSGLADSGLAADKERRERPREVTACAQPSAAGRCERPVAAGGVPVLDRQALLFAVAEDLVQEILAGWLVAQPDELNGRAARAKRTTVKRIKDRDLDRSGQIIAGHRVSLGVWCGDATRRSIRFVPG